MLCIVLNQDHIDQTTTKISMTATEIVRFMATNFMFKNALKDFKELEQIFVWQNVRMDGLILGISA